MTPTKPPRRPDWRKAGFAAAAVGLNAGAVMLLSMTDPGLRARSLRPAPMIVYLEEAWPSLVRARRAPSVTSSDSAVAATRRAQASQGDAPNKGDPPMSATPPPPSSSSMSQVNADDGIDARWRVGGALAEPSLSSLSCNAPHRLAPDDRRRCEERWNGGEAAPVIRGTGNAERDAAFARQGARRLAAWEAQRADPPRGDPQCVTPHPMAGCEGVNIQVDLFSSRDGFLPNLRKRRE
ncbi:hypothetical protein ABIB58_001592 [Brevundimonas sp. UYEF29]|uniref:hypothetical protein n=1 Tax=Brevundimonas sp. UYEF29 TaxID=3156346 RepID=UPI0033986686